MSRSPPVCALTGARTTLPVFRLTAERQLSVAANHLSTYREECGAAEARITNSAVAADAAEPARLQILQGAASAVLAQANQQPQLALMLLEAAG